MNKAEILKNLKAHGSEQSRKIYMRHGSGKNIYGVSFAHLGKLRKQIGINHKLAQSLWKTNNVEARVLAAMVADPELLTKKEAKQWISDVTYYMISNYLGGLFAKADFAQSLMEEEMRSKREILRHNGYDILATVLKNNPDSLTRISCRKYLKTIEKEIHSSPNRARNAMNNALIALGVYKPALEKEVIAAAKRIGVVKVDHGDTSCKTPDAVSYIKKVKAHRKRRR